jgi:hypothetical protein
MALRWTIPAVAPSCVMGLSLRLDQMTRARVDRAEILQPVIGRVIVFVVDLAEAWTSTGSTAPPADITVSSPDRLPALFPVTG